METPQFQLELLYFIRDNWHKVSPEEQEFIHFCGEIMCHVPYTYSQCFQDLWALHETSYQFNEKLFFVDVGASDGKTINNTYLLQSEYNWSGILVEPNPVWQDALHANRLAYDWVGPDPTICQYAVHNESGRTVNLLCPVESELAVIEGYGTEDEHAEKRTGAVKVEVETITLYDLLELKNAPEHIAYVSLDTEGSEYDILSKFFEQNNGKYIIRLMSIEHNYIPEVRDKIFNLMTKNGYERRFEKFPSCDDFYKLKESE